MQKRSEEVADNLIDDSKREIVVSRLINAPVTLVFKAWTDPHHLANWWGPVGFRNEIIEMDVRPGGVFRLVMVGPDGRRYANRIQYLEVVPNKLITYTQYGDETVSNIQFEVTINFEKKGNKTLLRLRSLFPTGELRERVIREYGALEGAIQMLDRLEQRMLSKEKGYDYAPEQQLHLSRTFDAPRELVFDAFSEAKHLARWWGPKGFDMAVKNFRFSEGGTFHFHMSRADGMEMWGKFVFQLLDRPKRIVLVNSFSNAEGQTVRGPFSEEWPREMLIQIELTEINDRTKLDMRVTPIHASETEYLVFEQGFSSMQGGFGSSLERLDLLLSEIK